MAPFQKGAKFVLRLFGPFNPIGSYWAWSVDLTTLFLGRLSPLSGLPALCTFFQQKLTTGENDSKKYFMINLHERILPARVEPPTSWYQLDVHPTEQPRPAERREEQFWQFLLLKMYHFSLALHLGNEALKKLYSDLFSSSQYVSWETKHDTGGCREMDCKPNKKCKAGC